MSLYPCTIWIGFDPKETNAFTVARESIRFHLISPSPVRGVVLDSLIKRGLYTRPTQWRLGRPYDLLSARDDYDGQMSTEFAISRFLVPHMTIGGPIIWPRGWAMFVDCDVLVRANIDRLIEGLDRRKALYCVKHKYEPASGDKMDGAAQTSYPRKNWSSVMLFNLDHGANQQLTLDVVNSLPGRDLHRFCWLEDKEIGGLEPHWNWLVGEQPEPEGGAKIVHWTRGGPWLNAFQNEPYADDYRRYLHRWAA